MKKIKLAENVPLKIVSVVIAVVLWMFVVNVEDPVMTASYTIYNVEVINQAYIDNIGKMYMLDEMNRSGIRVTIKAERKKLSKINASNLKAVADLQQAVSLDTDPVMVPITVTCDGVSVSNIEITPKNLSVRIEEKKTQEFVVNVSRGNTNPGKGYEVGVLSSYPEKVKITGPSSLINKIDKVTANIRLEGRTEELSQETELVIIDKNGETFREIEMSYLNVPKVVITAKLWEVVKAKLQAGYTGQPADGYQVEKVVTIPDTISIAGSEEALKNLELQDGKTVLYAGAVDISGKETDYEQKINITNALPEGVKLTANSSEDVWIRVSILPIGGSVYHIPTQNIEVKNSPPGMQVAFETDKIEVRVKKAEGLEELNEEQLLLSIDLNSKETGIYEVPVQVELPEGYELVKNVTAEVEVSKIESRN